MTTNTLPDDPCPTCGQRGCTGYCDPAAIDPDFGECPSCMAQNGLCRACEAMLIAQADYYEEEARRSR